MKRNLTFRGLIHEAFEVLELRRGILKTIFVLFYNPKKVVVGFIENQEGVFSGPIRVFWVSSIVFALFITIHWNVDEKQNEIEKLDYSYGGLLEYYELNKENNYFRLDNTKYNLLPENSKDQINQVNNIVSSYHIDSNPLYTLPFTIVFYSLLTFLLCRNYFKYYIEHLCMNIYLCCATFIIEFILLIIFFVGPIQIIFSKVFCVFVYWRTLNWEKKKLKLFLLPIIIWYNPVLSLGAKYQLSDNVPDFLNIILFFTSWLSYNSLQLIYYPILNFYVK